MKYWLKVSERKPNLALPFFHLKSEGFWWLHANVGYETALKVTTQIKTVSRLREIVAYANFDDEFFLLLTNTHDREVIRQTLIDTYFADFKADIESLITKGQTDRCVQAGIAAASQTNIFISTTVSTNRSRESNSHCGFPPSNNANLRLHLCSLSIVCSNTGR